MINTTNKVHMTFFERTKTPMFVSDGTQYIDCNFAALNILGLSEKEEVLNSQPADHSVEYQFDGMKSNIKYAGFYKECFETGSAKFEWSFKNKTDQIIPILVSLTLVHQDSKKFIFEEWEVKPVQVENDVILNTLYNISNAVNTTVNLDELYESIHRILNTVIDATNFFIALYDKKKDLLWFPYEKDEKYTYGQIEHASQSTAMSINVIKENKAFCVNKNAFDGNDTWDGCEQWLGVPLNVKGEVIGVMTVQSYHTPDLYDEKDIKFLMAVSDQIAVAIDRKRSEEALVTSEIKVKSLSKQTEEFSLVAASIITMKNEKDIFKRICNAIIEYSDFNSIIISYFTKTPPYHDILGYQGIDEKCIKTIQRNESPIYYYEKYYDCGVKLSDFSFYIPHALRELFEDSNTGNNPEQKGESENFWYPDNQLFVKMQDDTGSIIGVITVANSKSGELPTDQTVKPLEVFSSLISQIILYKKAQNEILAKEYKSELADLTSGTLHNVKNVLTSVKVSSGLIKENIFGPAFSSFKKANQLLRDNYDTVESFILENPKGKKLLRFYLKIEELFQAQFDNATTQINRLIDKVDSIETIISIQQGYGGSDLMVRLPIEKIIEDALLMQSGSNAAYGIKIIKEFESVRSISIQKTKLIHILINLIKNSRESMIEKNENPKIITLKLFESEQSLIVKVTDTGIGIPKKNIGRMFTHGFTTKKDGHGFGLVSCKTYMEEMNGKLWVESEGDGCGVSFFLSFPFSTE